MGRLGNARVNKLKEELREGETLWGLPQKISDELVDSYRLTLFRWLGFWLFMIIMCGGFIVGAWIWAIAESILWQNAINTAENIDGFAYDTNYGFGLLIGVFVWIFSSGVIVSLLLIITPMPFKGALFLSSFSDVSSNTPKIPLTGPRVEFNASHATASDLINDYSWRIVRKLGLILSPFIALVLVLSFAELRWYNVLGPYGMHTTVPWSTTERFRPWQDVEIVKLGCNQTGEGGSLIYEVIWPDGKKKRLPIDTHVNNKPWLTNLEAIDAEISKGGAVFRRWNWLNRDPLHPSCLRGFYTEIGESRKIRFDKLLRIGELY